MPTTYVSRISTWIEKRFNAKGGNVITDVDPTAVVMAQFQSGVEDRYLQGWNTYIDGIGVAAVAAQFSRYELRNPPGSNVIGVIESLYFNVAGIDWSIANSQPNLANLSPAQLNRVDARSQFGGPSLVRSFDNNATQFPGAANVVMRRGIGEVIVHPDMELTILPNDSLFIATDVVNTAIQLSIKWRERALEQSELT